MCRDLVRVFVVGVVLVVLGAAVAQIPGREVKLVGFVLGMMGVSFAFFRPEDTLGVSTGELLVWAAIVPLACVGCYLLLGVLVK